MSLLFPPEFVSFRSSVEDKASAAEYVTWYLSLKDNPDGVMRSVTSHGAEKDFDLQMRAKLGEAGFCRRFYLPVDHLFVQGRTAGWDAVINGTKVEIKATQLRYQYLFWPTNKNKALDGTPCDVLVLVKNDLNGGYIRGWMSKADFIQRKLTAKNHRHLTDGTLYVPETWLEPIETLCGSSCDFTPPPIIVPAGPSLRLQIEAVRWTARHIDDAEWRRMRQGERALLAGWLGAAARTLRKLAA